MSVSGDVAPARVQATGVVGSTPDDHLRSRPDGRVVSCAAPARSSPSRCRRPSVRGRVVAAAVAKVLGRRRKTSLPPQTIISVPVQTASWCVARGGDVRARRGRRPGVGGGVVAPAGVQVVARCPSHPRRSSPSRSRRRCGSCAGPERRRPSRSAPRCPSTGRSGRRCSRSRCAAGPAPDDHLRPGPDGGVVLRASGTFAPVEVAVQVSVDGVVAAAGVRVERRRIRPRRSSPSRSRRRCGRSAPTGRSRPSTSASSCRSTGRSDRRCSS